MVTTSANGYAATAVRPQLTRLGDLLDAWREDAEAAHEAYTTGTARGPITGLRTLDRELGGLLAPGLHILHGEPGTGKTALALQIAATCGCPALYVTCEMAPLELLRRHTARVTGTFLGRLKSGELTPDQSMTLVKIAIGKAPDLALADATRCFADQDWIRQAADATRGTSRHLLIILDSVHAWSEATPGGAPEYDSLNAAIAAIRTLASQLDAAVLGIAERNRQSMRTGGMNAAAGSRRFEYTGETVIDLSRDEKGMPTLDGSVPVTVVLAKNRHGSPGKKLSMLFNGALQRFTEA